MKIYFRKNNAVTLTEITTAIIILSILAVTGIGVYSKATSNVRRKEAQAVLREIAVAQRIYYNQHNDYWPEVTSGVSQFSSDIGQINQALHLQIPDSSEWTFCVEHRRMLMGRNQMHIYAQHPVESSVEYIWTQAGSLPSKETSVLSEGSWPSGCN